VGDIDGDNRVEVIARSADFAPWTQKTQILAFENDGTLKWSQPSSAIYRESTAFALADLDNDGSVEIIDSRGVYDAEGKELWAIPGTIGAVSAVYVLPLAADLDGDRDLEIILGSDAYHHDGQKYFSYPLQPYGEYGALPLVANLDNDPEPKVVLTAFSKIIFLEHDGVFKKQKTLAGTSTYSLSPPAVHDFNGDGRPEVAVSTGIKFLLFTEDLELEWSRPMNSESGVSVGTSFDFLGDGTAEAVCVDDHTVTIVNSETGEVFGSLPRNNDSSPVNPVYNSGQYYVERGANPVVADVDNDGSAEIVVVSNNISPLLAPTVKVIKARNRGWVSARRIWNQHTYHVNNVREDGTIPRVEEPFWKPAQHNTFRTQAQLRDGHICTPPVVKK
jgi:outer membrane protein assembly factor BamB